MLPANPSKDDDTLNRRLIYALGAVLLLIAALVFSQVVGFKLLRWDDDQHVVKNEHFNPVTWRGLLYFWGYAYIYMYIPVSYDFWGLLAWIAQFFPSSDPAEPLNPAVFHVGNLLIHLANATLVYRLLLRLVRGAPAAFCGAMLFAVHPLQTESVCWVGETRGTLCALFSLLALHKYLDFVGVDPRRGMFANTHSEPPARRRSDYVWATAFYCLALLSKPSAVSWPAIVWVVEVVLLRGSWRDATRRLALWFAVASVIAGLTKHYQKTEIIYSESVLPWSARPLLIGDTYAFYLRKLVWPSQPSFDYGRTPYRAAASPGFRWAWLLPTAVLAALLVDRKRRRLWLGGFAFFVLAVAPVSGVVPFLYQSISTVADRYMYVPLIGFGLMLAAALAQSRSTAGYALAGMLLTIGALRTFEQTSLWRNDEVVFRNGLRVAPDSFIAHLILGDKYRDEQRYDLAIVHYRRVLEIRPDLYLAQTQIGECLFKSGRFAAALPEYQAVVDRQPKDFDSRLGLGRVQSMLGKKEEARKTLEKALKLADPDSPEAAALRTTIEKLSAPKR